MSALSPKCAVREKGSNNREEIGWATACNPAKAAYFSAEMHSSVPGSGRRRYLIRLVALYDCNRACERRVDTVPAESAKAITKAQQ